MRILLHLERTDDGFVWWAESPEQPGFSALAPTLKQLKELVLETISAEGWADPSYQLSDPQDEPVSGPSTEQMHDSHLRFKKRLVHAS